MTILTQASEELMREALTDAMEFMEEEAENRMEAGSEMSDYAREPRLLFAKLAMALELLSPTECPGCGACPGFTGVDCDETCEWATTGGGAA